MSQRAHVVIIGAGLIGASIAYHLALRGCRDVLLLEKEASAICGSTARSAAGVRHQFSSAINIQLSRYSIERLRNFDQEVGGHAELRQVGYLLLFSDAAVWAEYQSSVALQRELGVPTECLTPQEAARFVPRMRSADLVGATFCPDDGYVDPHGIGMGYVRAAQAMGVRLQRDTTATGFTLAGGRVVGVRTNHDPVSCEFVVNATGPWAGEVGALAGLSIPVRPYRRNIYMTTPFPQIPGTIPLTIDMASGFYMRHEGASMLMGRSNPAEPSSFNQNVDWAWLDQVLEAGLQRFPILEEAGLAESQCWAGLYEITPDHNPILGHHPDLPGYLDASGFSGHGIMHSPATGMLIAEELLDGRAHTINIDELRITRFQQGAAHHERNII
ncbi:NAD(P)/FAD-dependent oxidoreductase [Candidatus Viridilinea mediisalina]|uniref:FAD-dependent oxidoreductase n=1 Tax=Candidatus Viridilinea mediisalina TaxID=2024553 RepID=A0A2A6RP84_9CHLR|nr:FAD-binding oxidoreductase [Candidatus Viridilinea mediisalina]PDW04660.1 FAD-dependent oxidoreductase [Candidatus Viridilinea mediisalina]